jgi:hypothetical protein
MKTRKSKSRKRVTLMPPHAIRHPLLAFLAPDLYENGKLRKHNVSILDVMPNGKLARKSAASAK